MCIASMEEGQNHTRVVYLPELPKTLKALNIRRMPRHPGAPFQGGPLVLVSRTLTEMKALVGLQFGLPGPTTQRRDLGQDRLAAASQNAHPHSSACGCNCRTLRLQPYKPTPSPDIP